MSAIQALLRARETAIALGDKALGREIYHQLQEMGVKPEDIDSGRIVVESQPETTQAPAPPERAVPPKPAKAKG